MPRRGIEGYLWEVGDLGRMTEELQRSRPRVARARAWEPSVDVFEDDRRLLIRAEIAGVRGEDITLTYVPDRHSLILRGVREEVPLGDEGRTTALNLEVYYGEFSREIALPDVAIEPHEIRAQYRNGFLVVSVPKLERAEFVRVTLTPR